MARWTIGGGGVNDTQVAGLVADDDSATAVALKAASDARIKAEVPRALGVNPIRRVTLVDGFGGNEVYLGNHATIADDTTSLPGYGMGKRVTNTSAAPEFWATMTSPVSFPVEASAFGVEVYIDGGTVGDPVTSATLDAIYLSVYCDDAFTGARRWVRSTASDAALYPLRYGKNTLRFHAAISTRDATLWGRVKRVVVGATTSVVGASFTVGRVWVEAPEKASVVVIEDGGYVNFLNNGWPLMRDRGIPVTWSIDPYLLGTTAGGLSRITEAQYLDLVRSTPLAWPGYHAWGDVETSGMTAAQLSQDHRRCIAWHQQRGIHHGMYWRSSYWQNLAAAGNDPTTRTMLLGAATYNGRAGVDVWPPVDRYNITRKGIHAADTTAVIDSHMATLKSTRGLWLPYTHGVQANPTQYEASTAVWTHLADAIAQGVSEGWLQAVTLDDLFFQSGGRFRQGFGGRQIAEYMNKDGDLVTQALP